MNETKCLLLVLVIIILVVLSSYSEYEEELKSQKETEYMIEAAKIDGMAINKEIDFDEYDRLMDQLTDKYK